MKSSLIRTGLEMFLAGCLVFSSANYYAKAEEEKTIPGSENSAPTMLKDEGLYEEIFRGNIKNPENLIKNPKEKIVNMITLYPSEPLRRLEGTNILEKIANGFENEIADDPLYFIRDTMWEPPLKDHESLDEVPYAPQMGEAVWDAFRSEYGWAKIVDKGLKKVQKVSTVDLTIKEKRRLKIRPVIASGKLKARIDYLGFDQTYLHYINSEVDTDGATIDFGRYTSFFGEKSEMYLELSQNYKTGEWSAIFYLEVPNLSFWKNKSKQKDLNYRYLINTGEKNEKSNQ